MFIFLDFLLTHHHHVKQTLIPVDFKNAGQIVDDDIYKDLVVPMKAGVNVTVLVRTQFLNFSSGRNSILIVTHTQSCSPLIY